MAYLLLTLTVLFWSGNFVLARAMHLELPPITMAFSRWSLALLLILPWLLPRVVRQWAVIRQHIGILCFFGVVGVAGFNTQVYLGLQDTTATNAVLMQSVIPIIILVLAALLFGQREGAKQWLGVALSFVGVTVLISQGRIEVLTSLAFNRGDLWVFGAVLVWAVYSLGLRWKPKALDGFTFFGVTVIIAVVCLSPLAVWELANSAPIEWSVPVFGTVTYMALFPSILSYLFWNRGVEELGAAVAGLFIHLMPVFGLLLSVVFLDEQIHTFHLFGVVLIFSGIYLAVISDTLKRLQRK